MTQDQAQSQTNAAPQAAAAAQPAPAPQAAAATATQPQPAGRTFDLFAFDMDGTVLDTLPDLVNTTNTTLRHFGYPEHTADEILGMVGKGIRSTVTQAMPPDLNPEALEEGIAWWRAYYDVHGADMTRAYEGIADTMAQLKARGKKVAIVSNKYNDGVLMMTKLYFDGLVDFAIGDGAMPRKPDPTGLLLTLDKLGVPAERCAFVGDTDIDINTAHNAGVFAIGVTWGYQPRERVAAANPGAIIDRAEQLLDFA